MPSAWSAGSSSAQGEGSSARRRRGAGTACTAGAAGTAGTGAGSIAEELRSGSHKPRKRNRQNFITRLAAHWWNRLLGGMAEGSFAEQDEIYGAHKTSRDYICNSLGAALWGALFPLLTIVVTQVAGVERAGMFSLAFVTGSLLMILANYGVRTYQVSDLDERHTFADYQINRILTCAGMVLVGVLYCTFRGYTGEMFLISMGVYVYKMVDALADVYEGRLQQVDKMYLGGISQAFRSAIVFVVFCLALLISGNVGVAAVAMAVAALATFFFLTLPLALLETPKSREWSASSIVTLFKQTSPLFVALFLYAFIDAMPKFVMEGALPYDSQLYFNVIYFPAQMILIIVQLVYKPLLVKLAGVWADPSAHRRFDQVILAMLGIIVAITAVMALFVGWIGIPIMSLLYGVDFEPYRGLFYIMLAAGAVASAIDFLYQVITVLRRQKDVTRLYLIAFGFSLFVPWLLIGFTGLPGAVIGYLILMAILLVLLGSEYIAIRAEFSRSPHKAAAAFVAQQNAAAAGAAVPAGLAVDFDPAHVAEEEAFDAASAAGTLDEEQLQRAGYVKIPTVGSGSHVRDVAGCDDALDEPGSGSAGAGNSQGGRADGIRYNNADFATPRQRRDNKRSGR